MSFIEEAKAILRVQANHPGDLMDLYDRRSKLVPFVGAGLSMEFGCMSWRELLLTIAETPARREQVESYLKENKYEEAAEALWRNRSAFFDRKLREILESRFTPPLDRGAVRCLPWISKGPVLTTNMDTLVEAAFDGISPELGEPYRGIDIRDAGMKIQAGQRCLLKLHGDFDRPSTRVLTLTEYEKAYGSIKGTIDTNLPLASVMVQVMGGNSLLFLGCSLEVDRTTRIIAAVADIRPSTIHFALLPETQNKEDRVSQLDQWRIIPIFYPNGQYDKIEQFLKCLARYVAPPSSWPEFIRNFEAAPPDMAAQPGQAAEASFRAQSRPPTEDSYDRRASFASEPDRGGLLGIIWALFQYFVIDWEEHQGPIFGLMVVGFGMYFACVYGGGNLEESFRQGLLGAFAGFLSYFFLCFFVELLPIIVVVGLLILIFQFFSWLKTR